jgi:hypothetical protein
MNSAHASRSAFVRSLKRASNRGLIRSNDFPAAFPNSTSPSLIIISLHNPKSESSEESLTLSRKAAKQPYLLLMKTLCVLCGLA